MRAATRVVAGLTVLAVVAAACADSGPGAATTTTIAPIELTTTVAETTTTTSAPTTTAPATTTTQAPDVPGGEIVIGLDIEPATLNPYAPGGDFIATTGVLGQLHLAGVYDFDGTTRTFIPELVEELPTPANGGVVANDDGTVTVRYRIRDEAQWSDAIPISGDDFQFTLETILELPDQSDAGVGFDKTGYDLVVSTEAGPKTFEFTMAEPSVAYQTMFRHLIPKHAVEGTNFTEDWNTTMWPSAGPFVLDVLVPGDGVRFVRNENYWKRDPGSGDALPHLGAVTFWFQPEAEVMVNAMINGQVDIYEPPPFGTLIDAFARAGGIDVRITPSQIWEHINFQFGPENRNPDSLNGELAFRQAVAYGIDLEVLAEAAGWGPPIATMRTSGADPSDGPWNQYAYSPETARGLIVAACGNAGRDCAIDPPRAIYSSTSNSDARPAVAEALVPMFADMGVQLELQLEDSQLFFGETLDRGTWDIGEWAWVHSEGMANDLTIIEIFDPDAVPPDGNNFYRWGSPDTTLTDDGTFDVMRGLLGEMRSTIDPAAFDALFTEAEQLLADNAVIIPIAARRSVLAAREDRVAGYVANPTLATFTWNIEHWYMP